MKGQKFQVAVDALYYGEALHFLCFFIVAFICVRYQICWESVNLGGSEKLKFSPIVGDGVA